MFVWDIIGKECFRKTKKSKLRKHLCYEQIIFFRAAIKNMIQLIVNNAHSDIDISTPWHSLT